MKKILALVFALSCLPAVGQTVYFVGPNGGTRAQCDGTADVPYTPSTSTTVQHCQLQQYRMLYDNGSYGNSAWIFKGGDIALIHQGAGYRVGFDTDGTKGNDPQCLGGPGTYNCYNPKIPAGTAALHTKIFGENFASCTDKSKMTQLFGGHGLQTVIDARGAQYVDIQCIELTRHSQCVQGGPASGPGAQPQCSKNAPIDDYASDGIMTDVNTHDLNLQDMWIHGLTSRGIIGPIGGVVNATNVDISTNGGGGWDFDDGNSTKMPAAAQWNFTNSIVEWSGCNQTYPSLAILSCYGQSDSGYGDGVGGPAGTGFGAKVTGSIFRYNAQDGLDLGHTDTGNFSLSITNSTFIGNAGGAFKWGPNYQTATISNNYVLANCHVYASAIAGTVSGYNGGFVDFCRAGDAISFNFRQGGTVSFTNNTVVTYAPNTLDIQCWDQTGSGSPNQGLDGAVNCSSSKLNIAGNIFLAYNNPSASDYSGSNGPGAIFFRDTIGSVTRTNNTWYGMGHGWTCVTGESCADPKLTGELINFTDEPTFTNAFAALPVPSAGSPATGQGATSSTVVTPPPVVVPPVITNVVVGTYTFHPSLISITPPPVTAITGSGGTVSLTVQPARFSYNPPAIVCTASSDGKTNNITCK